VGKAQAAGKRTDLFLNEAYYITFEVADALMGRTSGNVWIDYNPHAAFWVHDELLGRNDVCFLKLVPGDNEALPDTIRHEHQIKREKAKTSEYWSNWCRVFLDGELGRFTGTILSNWIYGNIDASLPYGFGLDFGFNDPDAMVKVAIDHKAKKIYMDERIYKDGNSYEQLKQLVASHANRNDLIIADCADARMINELRRYFNIRGVNKKKWTVAEALKMMQDYEIIVTETSINLVRELRNYVWNDKRAGIPIDDFNHLIDAARYYFQENATIKTPQVWHA
jgi:phage terminase large subunit